MLPSLPRPRRLLATVLTAFLLASVTAIAAPPSLVVVISIDQFRYDYLERFEDYFGDRGFNLLRKQGVDFTDCHLRHSSTKTGPGHAVMLTGVHANLHGIISNDWIDRNTFEQISCVGDKDVQIVGLPATNTPHLPGINDPHLGRSPKNLLVTTVGDQLKLDRGGRAKVIGISNKDRAAILMSGKLADAAYFMEYGRMVSSTYYMKELPEWVKTWNAAGKAEAYFGKVWDRILPAEAYRIQGPDDAPGEDVPTLGTTFPRTITGGDKTPGPKFYDAFENTPFSNEVLTDFAEAAVTNEQLGGRPGATDILCLSYSANDHIGHLFGPDSHEIMDNVVRMDRTLAQFFAFLDQKVGLQHCLIILTADHGVAPMPERVHALRPDLPAGREYGPATLAAAEAAMNKAYGPLANKGRWLLRDDAWFLFFPEALREKNVQPEAAQKVVRDALMTVECVQAAYTRAQLEHGDLHDDLGHRAWLSFNRARSGDVFFQPKPFFFAKATGSQHGSPYNYDTHVPLLWFGAGLAPAVRTDRVGTDDLAPTLSHLLGIPAPPLAEGHVLLP